MTNIQIACYDTTTCSTCIIVVFHNDFEQVARIRKSKVVCCFLGLIWLPPGAAQNHKGQPKQIIALSHIETLPTYHKYLKNFRLWGTYGTRPVIIPGYRSEVELLFF